MSAGAAQCPVHAGRDDRKSAAIADANLTPQKGARVIGSFAGAREVLRSPRMLQWGAHSAKTDISDPTKISFFFLDGEPHRKRRAAVAGLFAPKAIVTRHRAVMDATMDRLEAQLKAAGSLPLDELSFQMAVDVAAEIIGLTNSGDPAKLAARVKHVLDSSATRGEGWLADLVFKAKMAVRVGRFWKHDLKPAIEARRTEPRDDVISHLLKDNHSNSLIIMECLSYGGAGMMTTREFIVMCAWHLFDSDALRERFLGGGEDDQFAILEEILRLEPVASLNHRRAAEAMPEALIGDIDKDEVLAINIRAVNTDEAVAGECPFALDPDRAKRQKVAGAWLSFGDGAHRCPGAQVALHETRVFLDRLLRMPGIRMETAPTVTWNAFIQGYELRGCTVACDPA